MLSCTVVQWLDRPYCNVRQLRFDAQTMHCFSVLFFLMKVVREKGGHRVYVGIRYPGERGILFREE